MLDFPAALLPKAFGGRTRTGNRRRKGLDYEQHMCFKFWLRIGRHVGIAQE